ncbi:MAG TPA: M14 family metallopeptidase [Chloroflexota bacterium]|nr:M14 family metallopeptidase [Chloroflexota bacterium]
MWEVDADRALVLAFPDEVRELADAGYALVEVRRFPAAGRGALGALFGSGAYRGHDAVQSELRAIASAYPGVVSLHDLGPSWEGRRLIAARVTSAAGGAGKPAALYLSAYHAREVVTPELALRTLRYFAEAYGRDPLITHLLDTRELWIAPLVNPDGYARVEAGAEWWRKNADPVGSCGPSPGQPVNPRHPGVDLNRNHAYAWNAGGGASTNPCDETYQGPAAVSEPETQAVQRLVESTAARVLISWHSYGNVVLWPPTSRADPQPADPLLGALGGRLARLTGYRGGTGGVTLYLTTGELTEWAWYVRHVAAFTVEVGAYADGTGGNPFAPPYGTVERYWTENKPAVLYLARVADDPNRASAPDVEELSASLPFGAPTATVSASLSPGAAGSATAAELFLGTPGTEGNGLPGRLEAGGTRVGWSVSVAGLAPGRHTVWARARAASGPWGPLGATSVLVGRQALTFPLLARAGTLN